MGERGTGGGGKGLGRGRGNGQKMREKAKFFISFLLLHNSYHKCCHLIYNLVVTSVSVDETRHSSAGFSP